MRPLKVALVGSLLWAAIGLLAMPTPTQASAAPSPPGQAVLVLMDEAPPFTLDLAAKVFQTEVEQMALGAPVRRQAVLLLWTRERVARPVRCVWRVQVSPLRGSPPALLKTSTAGDAVACAASAAKESIPEMVRAKFKCVDKKPESVTRWDGEKSVAVPAESITMSAVCGGSEENDKFFASSPGGSFHFYAANQAAADQFVIGREYYLDFTPADA